MFLAASTIAPSPAIPAAAHSIARVETRRIQDIKNTLTLRSALSVVLPAWRGALRGIPALWAYIAVAVDKLMWSATVLDAIREALDCARDEPLSLLITRAPRNNGDEGISGGDSDGGEIERTRVMQLMALFTPRISRWCYLGVFTLHSAALPIPTLDFAGEAPLMSGLHLRAALPARPTTTATTASGNAGKLVPSGRCKLKMDVHAFVTAYISNLDALPAVESLWLHEPRTKGVGRDTHTRSSPEMSVRALTACAVRMRILLLSLDRVHLAVGCDKD